VLRVIRSSSEKKQRHSQHAGQPTQNANHPFYVILEGMFRPDWIRNRVISERIQNYWQSQRCCMCQSDSRYRTLIAQMNLPRALQAPRAGLSKSALYLNTATRVDAMENEDKRIATNPAIRAILSRPGEERKVTDALKRTAAFCMETN
jgi:hypothetical protein